MLVAIICLLMIFWSSSGGRMVCASAAVLSEIRQRGYIVVAVKENLPPLGFRDPNGELQGLEIDIAKALAVDLLGEQPDTIKFQPVANRERIPAVLNQKVDLAIARVTATASRSRMVSFSVPYYFDGTMLLTKDASVEKLSDLTSREIAILKNSSTIASVRYYLPDAKLVGVSSYEEARSLLESNKVTAFAADASVLTGWVQKYPQYRLLPTRLSTEPLSVVMPRGLQYDELRRQVNEVLARYVASGWLQERAKYWGLPL